MHQLWFHQRLQLTLQVSPTRQMDSVVIKIDGPASSEVRPVGVLIVPAWPGLDSVIFMRCVALSAWITPIIVILGAMASAGCSGCEDPLLDRVEHWLRDNPDRPGKVGTLRALEVSQTARSVADWRLTRGDVPCDIGWSLDEPFQIDFELHIEVEHPGWTRRWEERGNWTRDRRGHWMIDAHAEFESAEGLRGERLYRVLVDDDGFWEWMGPDAVAHHKPDAKAAASWQGEYGGRFSGLMMLVSPTWQRADGDQDTEQAWIPGGEPRLCGPIGARDGRASWKPLLEARASRRRALIGAEKIPGADDSDDKRQCRYLEAHYALSAGGGLDIYLRECHRSGPNRLDAVPIKRSIAVHRAGDGLAVTDQLQRWITEGIATDIESQQLPME